MPRWLQGAFWLAVYLGAVLTPLVVLLVVRTPPGGGFWWDVAIGFGFAGLVMMAAQFLLTSRFRKATAPFGIDVIYYFHRYLAYVALAALLAHPVVLIAINPALLPYVNPIGAPIEMAAGTIALILLFVLVGASAWRKRLRIPYEFWRVTHLLLACAVVGLALAHIGIIGYYAGIPAVRALWIAIGMSLVAVVLWVRLIRPWMLTRAPFRVAEVRSESDDAWTVHVEPDGHPGFSFEPGQFAWVTMRSSPFAMREHPYSIASAPGRRGALDFTIKELGDFTRTVGKIRSGEVAYVDGPYGAFSIDRFPDTPGYVFIAGGIGIAPMMSMLKALADRGDDRPHRLFTAHSREERVPLRGAVAEVQQGLDLRVVNALEDPPEGWSGETGFLTHGILDDNLPANRNDLEYFICGPIPLIRSVQNDLRALGVPGARIHTELFDLV